MQICEDWLTICTAFKSTNVSLFLDHSAPIGVFRSLLTVSVLYHGDFAVRPDPDSPLMSNAFYSAYVPISK